MTALWIQTMTKQKKPLHKGFFTYYLLFELESNISFSMISCFSLQINLSYIYE